MQAPCTTPSSYLDSELQGDPVFQNTLSPEPLGKEQDALRSQEPETERWGGSSGKGQLSRLNEGARASPLLCSRTAQATRPDFKETQRRPERRGAQDANSRCWEYCPEKTSRQNSNTADLNYRFSVKGMQVNRFTTRRIGSWKPDVAFLTCNHSAQEAEDCSKCLPNLGYRWDPASKSTKTSRRTTTIIFIGVATTSLSVHSNSNRS